MNDLSRMTSGRGGARSKPLRIAIVSTCAVQTPPQAYGGTELVLADLARELALLGHEPVVFATGDSSCVGARPALFEHAIWPPDPLSELRHVAAAWQQIAREHFDVVHLNDGGGALPFTSFVRRPTVATVHHARAEEVARHYAAYPNVTFVGISQRQAELMWEVPFGSVIRHGLDPARYLEGSGELDHCAFLGRLSAEKGPHLAIDAARAAGASLLLAGGVHVGDRDYFTREVAPRLHGNVRLIGEVDHRRKMELLRPARCLLFPIQWEEPFGLVMIEAMLVGTPVVAFECGSVAEVVDEGVTGYVVRNVDEMRARIVDAARLDRKRCRARACERWGAWRMARDYVELYSAAIAEHRELAGSGARAIQTAL